MSRSGAFYSLMITPEKEKAAGPENPRPAAALLCAFAPQSI
jgi:hypothetical protein